MSEFSSKTLARIRSKLLDLTRRNRLLNYKESIRSIRIVDELPDETFKLLVLEGKTLELLPLSENKEEQLQLINLQDNSNKKRDFSTDKHIDKNIELPLPSAKTANKHKDSRLQTIFSDQVLERRCKKLINESRTAIEETGCNFLHLAIGFLEWYEDENSSEINRAPLILIPINIERTRIDRGINSYKYTISYTSEDIETNLSLLEKLNIDFNLILPPICDDIMPEEYFDKVRKKVSRMPRWKLAREMVIGLFSFSKLLMYKDLDNDRWPKGNKIEEHHNILKVLVGRQDGDGSEDVIYGEEYALDHDPKVSKVPIILDADSSQLSVIADAILDKKNLVVEGPPGTGKSQTIANLIAAALHENLSVLFVAEKKAALEVVRSRLDHAGLGDFCLELHSHKTQKGQLHADLAKRRNSFFHDARHLDSEMDDLVNERKHLLEYSNLVNSEVGPNRETVYDIFWAVEKNISEIKAENVIRYSVTNAMKLSRQQINDRVHILQDIARLCSEMPVEAISVWSGLKPKSLSPGDEQNISIQLNNLLKKVDSYIEFLENNKTYSAFSTQMKMDTIRKLHIVNMDVLSSKPQLYFEYLAPKFLDNINIDLLYTLDSKIAKYRQLVSESTLIYHALENDLDFENVKSLSEAADSLKSIGYDDKITSDIVKIIEIHDQAITILRELDEVAKATNNFMPEETTCIVDCQKLIAVNKNYVEGLSDITLKELHPHHVLESTKTLFNEARKECELLVERMAEYGRFFNIRYVPEPTKIDAYVCGLRKYRGSLFAIFAKEYREIKRSVKAILIDPKSFKVKNLHERLELLMDTIRKIENIQKNEQYRSVLGSLYSGIDTDWNKLAAYIDWGQNLSKTIGSQRHAHSLMLNISEVYKKLPNAAKIINEKLTTLKPVMELLNIDENSKINESVIPLAEHKKKIEGSISIILKYELLHNSDINAIYNAARSFLKSVQVINELNMSKEIYISLLEDEYRGINTDTGSFLITAKWVNELISSSKLSNAFIEWLVKEETEKKLSILIQTLKFNKDFSDICDKFQDDVAQYGDVDKEWLFGNTNSNTDLSMVRNSILQCLHNLNYLMTYCDYYHVKEKAIQFGLNEIVGAIELARISTEESGSIYKLAVYDSMAREIIATYPKLKSFTRSAYEGMRKRFADLDRSIITNFSNRIAYKASKRDIPHGNGYGPVKDYTDLALIDKELQKQKRHIPIRQLVRRATKALKAMKPCFMMSPMSVAQYLVPGEICFDLVVMDEASQLKPEDALGAIARAHQLVVVGDPKQLPPTTFFDRTEGIEEDMDEGSAIEDTKSILDICWLNYDKRRLRWHYRSEHESLIAFSNYQFYGGDLIIFPSPKGKEGEFGVHRHYIKGAKYLKGRNQMEAEAVAIAVTEHFKKNPHTSLGVATMNREQADLIRDIIEKKQKEHSWLEDKMKESESTAEPFFVKNLENVQGDERDVIFVSTTYGPDQITGKVYQRFGPITRDTGWRRLNVIFTRAKKRLELFTSLHSNDIILSENPTRGTRTLKEYLEYAETGRIPDYGKFCQNDGKEPDSDFEIAVCKILNDHGYRTIPQVGVAGFFIDIGVLHPERAGEFILGIECDGATYHSAKSVRDRDRLRQEILERKGWKIHRIWSTDWFKNREKEVQRLIDLIQQIVKDESSKIYTPSFKQKELDTIIDATIVSNGSSDGGTLEEELIHYRQANILPNFPNTSNGILRDEILEKLVRIKPTTKEDFYKFIPIHLRQNTDGKQMQFLEDILEIVESYSS